MEASVWGDVLKQFKGDKKKARAWLQNSEKEAASREVLRKEGILAELARMFTGLSEREITAALEECKWNEDAAIVPLLEMQEKYRIVAERRRREEEVRLRAIKRVTELFDGAVPAEEAQRLLVEHGGDVEEVARILLDRRAPTEHASRPAPDGPTSKHSGEAREVILLNLRRKFAPDLNGAEVEECLDKHGWNIKLASLELLKVRETRKIQQLKMIFTGLSEEEVSTALLAAGGKLYSSSGAIRMLQDLRRRKRALQRLSSPGTAAAEAPREAPAVTSASPAPAPEVLPTPEEAADKICMEIEQDIAHEQTPETMVSRYLRDQYDPGALHPATAGPAGESPFSSDDTPATVPPVDSSVGEAPPVREGADIPVEPLPFTVSLTVIPARVDVGQQFTVSWKTDDEVRSSDWIAMFKQGDEKYEKYKYNRYAVPEGSVTFTAVKHGTFMFKYFTKGTYTVKGQSALVEVGPTYDLVVTPAPGEERTFEVEAQQTFGNVYGNAWVALALVGSAPSVYYTYQWVSYATAGKLKFVVPKSGNWAFRLFPERSLHYCAETVLTIDGEDELSINRRDKAVVVVCELGTIDCSVDRPWVGLYHVTEEDSRQYRRYAHVCSRKSEVEFTVKTPGTYEARLFAHGSMTPIVVSKDQAMVV